MQDVVKLLNDVWGSTSGHFRAFHDSIRDPKLARKLSGEFASVATELESLNQSGYGVYFVVNHGGHDDASITHATAIMIDIDAEAGLPSSWHCQPHIILRKGYTQNYHVYWLLEKTGDIQEWSRTCKRLIEFYNSDPRIHNPSRVMRLPSFMHLKNPNSPETYNILYNASEAMPRYTLSDVAKGLPEVQHTASTGPRGEVLIESDDIYAIDRAMRIIEKSEPAIEGDGGNQTTFALFARLRDLGLSKNKSLELVENYYNPVCEPPWELSDLEIIAGNAYQYAASPQGNSNPIASFQALSSPTTAAAPVVPDAPTTFTPPPPATIAGIHPSQITVGIGYTKNHTESANRFLQEWYPAGTLMVVKDDWYYYDGKSWVETDEGSMKRGVTFAMANSTPSHSDITGTLAVLKSMCHSKRLLGEFPGRDPSSLVLLQNGILDINSGELMQHTSDFFSVNVLPYDYNPNATCPTWDKFLNDIFEGDQERIDFVEEWLGYMMVTDYSYQKIAMFIGVQRSGKTTIQNICKALIGQHNFMGIGLEGFAHDGTLEGGLSKTVLWVGDAGTISGPNRGRIVDNLKNISGNGDISCARKFKTPFSGRIPGRISITCNNVLHFTDDSGALAGRFVICPFNKSFYGKEDPTLEGRLLKELPGIAIRCITALKRLRARGRFNEPSAAQSERESITYRYSPVLAFIDDECKVTPGHRVHNERLYARYKVWSLKAGSRTMAYRPFIDALRSALRGRADKRLVSVDGIKAQGFIGLGLRDVETPSNVADFSSVKGGTVS